MFLYELRDPAVHKYGGELTQEEANRCVKEILLSPRWAPYPHKPIQIEHVCGRFGNFQGESEWRGMDERLEGVCCKTPTPFGLQTDLFHVRGQLTARNAPGLERTIGFKGVRGHLALRELIRDSLLPEATTSKVHMAVFGACLGLRLQTSPGCYLENKIWHRGPLAWVDVGTRCMDQINVVRLRVLDWGVTGLPQALWPVHNDLVLTGKGSVLLRLTWNGRGVEWGAEAEKGLVDACQWVVDALERAC